MRTPLIIILASFLLLILASSCEENRESAKVPETNTQAVISIDEAEKDMPPIDRLIAGNQRFMEEHFAHPHATHKRVREVSKAQHPFAVIVGCSDSRVPPSIIFDQGVGDLFIIRNAGNIVDDAVLGSVEYAVEHLGVELVLVLGHERCGAVTATLEGEKGTDHLSFIARHIHDACEKAKKKDGDCLDNAVRENIRHTVHELETDRSLLADAVESGKLKVVGAYYDLDKGQVSVMGDETAESLEVAAAQ